MIPIRDTIPSRRPPVVTWTIIGINAVVFLFELLMPGESQERLFYLFGIVPARFTHPAWAVHVGFPLHDYWPFLTSMFLHGGWLHVIGNMWVLWIFGDNVEDRMGHLRFAVFYVLCGLVAGIVQLAASPDSTTPTVGASGAIAGIMGAYLVLFPRARVLTLIPILIFPLFVELPAIVFLGIWFVIQLWSGTLTMRMTAQVGGVAFWAHVGGFLAGMVLHPLFLVRPPEPPPEPEAPTQPEPDMSDETHQAWGYLD